MYMSGGYSFHELKSLLDVAATRFNTSEFIDNDPIQFPRKYRLKQDIEISAFLTATIAWGKRSLILKSATGMHQLMGTSPYDYIMNEGYEKLARNNIHRTFFEEDMAYFCRGLHAIYQKYESCESLFAPMAKRGDLWDRIKVFRGYMQDANPGYLEKSLKHISNPEKSACKRLHMALRWLVRNDGIVDIGLWKNLSPADLYIPLDTHVITIGRALGLLKRKQNDRKAVEELTNQLRCFNPEDPVLYDFALFGLGESKSLSKSA